jgi:uncharacterized protein
MALRAGKPLRRRGRLQDGTQRRTARRAADRDRRTDHAARPSRSGVLALRRALGKPHFHVIGVDDGSFRREDRWAPVAAVALAVPARVEAVRVGRVRVDGTDATEQLARLVRATGGLESARAVLLDGAVVGGFNVIDLDRLYAAVGVPVVAITRRPPDFRAIRAALRKWFPRDADARWRRLTAHRLFALPYPDLPLLVAAVGCPRREAALLVRRTTLEGYVPEPVRLAHLIASAAATRPASREKG